MAFSCCKARSMGVEKILKGSKSDFLKKKIFRQNLRERPDNGICFGFANKIF